MVCTQFLKIHSAILILTSAKSFSCFSSYSCWAICWFCCPQTSDYAYIFEALGHPRNVIAFYQSLHFNALKSTNCTRRGATFTVVCIWKMIQRGEVSSFYVSSPSAESSLSSSYIQENDIYRLVMSNIIFAITTDGRLRAYLKHGHRSTVV